ncbi:MAG: response regulator transcription factor [Lachnospiraceae bacterium]|nr:response regulator transcription factor [Lachnospiraceae bacterium]
MHKILIVEDEKLIREELATLLSNAGYQTACVTDFGNTLARIKSENPDLILLDISLPGLNGYSICASVRQFSDVPILFITGRNTAMDELQALTLGGDDYISKPYNIPILLARINSLLKRRQPCKAPVCPEYQGIRLNPVAGTLTVTGQEGGAGQETELTKTELKIMYYLFEHPGEIVSRLDLVTYLWDNEIHIDDNTLSVNIMRIREKLRTLGVGELIQTKRGMGYKI